MAAYVNLSRRRNRLTQHFIPGFYNGKIGFKNPFTYQNIYKFTSKINI